MKISQLVEQQIRIDINGTDLSSTGCVPEQYAVNYVYSFSCERCHLTTLKNLPKHVENNLFIENNKLTDLNYCPSYIGGRLWAGNNPFTKT